MKRLLALGVACLAVIALSAVALTVIAYRYTNYDQVSAYASAAYVIYVDIDEDFVDFEDSDGFIWTIDGAGEWEQGDVAALLMHDNGTPDNVEDDVILSAVQSGFSLLPD